MTINRWLRSPTQPKGNGKLPSHHMTPWLADGEAWSGSHWTGNGIAALAEHQAGSLAEAPSGLPKAFFLTVRLKGRVTMDLWRRNRSNATACLKTPRMLPWNLGYSWFNRWLGDAQWYSNGKELIGKAGGLLWGLVQFDSHFVLSWDVLWHGKARQVASRPWHITMVITDKENKSKEQTSVNLRVTNIWGLKKETLITFNLQSANLKKKKKKID